MINESLKFNIFIMIYLIIILIKDIFMFLLNYDIWLVILTTIGILIAYWIIVFMIIS
ncbi:hypothetical protein LCGC14_1625230 [marine sediment metagenome]|uniref:Uncharacterized protein n=1 Tax=marine sediment metagenome TaxID=412755 RepID=A0A0F9I4B3_9ZZZZ